MALQINNYENQYGAPASNAYVMAKIVTINKVSAQIMVLYFYNEAAKNKTNIGVKSYFIKGQDFTDYLSDTALLPENKTPLSQAYLYLKTLPEFAGAIDV